MLARSTRRDLHQPHNCIPIRYPLYVIRSVDFTAARVIPGSRRYRLSTDIPRENQQAAIRVALPTFFRLIAVRFERRDASPVRRRAPTLSHPSPTFAFYLISANRTSTPQAQFTLNTSLEATLELILTVPRTPRAA